MQWLLRTEGYRRRKTGAQPTWRTNTVPGGHDDMLRPAEAGPAFAMRMRGVGVDLSMTGDGGAFCATRALHSSRPFNSSLVRAPSIIRRVASSNSSGASLPHLSA